MRPDAFTYLKSLQFEGLVHFSTWLPEGLAWAIRAKAVELHKKDYEVVTEAIKTYLESSS